ncbi:hypothetical protein DFH06DRAFT_1136069 [Mycena polygramma]|nr:hypothetical protein DFH06DRAFT_1136069 [Mycena polygramma]
MIERFKLLDWFNSRDVESLKGCDSMKCGGIHSKSEFMRCAGCLSMYYCSKACQSRDWREGHHRDSCSKLRELRFLENEAGITTRDRSFLRELIHHDYKVAREDILSGQLAMLKRFPDTPFCILFDYHNGRPSISGLPATDNVAVDALQFADFVSREQASAGRVETHLILVRQPRSGHPKIFPMHSSSSMVREKLERIASAMRLLGPGKSLWRCPSELKNAMSRLGEEQDKKVVYTH